MPRPNDPYVSVIFANRNDGYGDRQAERFDSFIRYYAIYDELYPGVFEFMVCDWNPPEGKPPLKAAADWRRLKNVTFVTVPPAIHASVAGGSDRQIFDYIARNVAIRKASAPWALIVNQDIFPTPGIFKMMGERKLNTSYFYRADRVDFDFSRFPELHASRFMEEARKRAVRRHRRQRGRCDGEISPVIDGESFLSATSVASPGEKIGPAQNMILGHSLSRLRQWDLLCRKLGCRIFSDPDRASGSQDYADALFLRYKLHANAAGDFILATKVAFEKIGGCPERTDFYMHTDMYAILNLFMAGFSQAIFIGEEVAYHAEHAIRDHMSFESWTWPQHQKLASDICRSGRPRSFSGPGWGLAGHELPTEKIGSSRD